MIHPLGINARIALFIVPYLMLLSTIGGLYILDTKVFRVVSEFKVESASYAQGKLTLSGSMRKVRDCSYTGLAVYGVRGTNPKNLLNYDFNDEYIKHRSQGFQTWGPWTITVPLNSNYDYIEIVASHRCVGPWTQETKYVEYDLNTRILDSFTGAR